MSGFPIPRLLVTDLREILGAEPLGFIQGFYGGSRVIVDPPPTDTDIDICVLVKDLGAFYGNVPGSWATNSADYNGDTVTFTTFRRGEYNLLVFEDATEFGACLGATAVAKKANITDKAERYRLFETARSPWR